MFISLHTRRGNKFLVIPSARLPTEARGSPGGSWGLKVQLEGLGGVAVGSGGRVGPLSLDGAWWVNFDWEEFPPGISGKSLTHIIHATPTIQRVCAARDMPRMRQSRHSTY